MAKRNRPARNKPKETSAEPVEAPPAAPRRGWRDRPRWHWLLAFFLLLAICSSAAAWLDWYVALPEDRVAAYAGNASCIACHDQQNRQWSGSDHDLAMDPATPATVLGDFSGVELEHYGFTSRMYRDGERYMIHTESPDGEAADYEIKYVFGFDPLQNYMVELEPPAAGEPGEVGGDIGTVQVLRETWDARQGKWYYLMPEGLDERLEPGDPLHWCGQAQNWNRACAECHSTNLEKNHEMVLAHDGSQHSRYHTSYSEIDVACEACHGPGSIHVELAEAHSLFWDRKRGYGLTPLNTLPAAAEVDNCGQCHSRRRQLADDFRPGDDYNDAYLYELIADGIYWCDGQIRDEDYVYGSFLQSRMYEKGIRCGDCHNPHTTELRHEGNAVCTSCHQHPAAKYNTPAHHHHAAGSAGASCVECHMPTRTYMGIDERRDHSLRVPRPDLSVDLGTPNACSQCHLADDPAFAQRQAELPRYQDWLEAAQRGDEDVAAALERLDTWSLEHATRWWGEPADRGTHFAYAFHGAWDMEPAALEPLLAVAGDAEQPAMIRASAVQALAPYLTPSTDYTLAPFGEARQTVLAALKDPAPRVRAAAVPLLVTLPVEAAEERAYSLLEDRSLAVRLEAVQMLIEQGNVPGSSLRQNEFLEALPQFQSAMALESDRPATQVLLAEMHLWLAQLGRVRRDIDQTREETRLAILSFEQAVALAEQNAGPRSHYAQRVEQFAMLKENSGQLEDAAQLRAEAARLRGEDLAILARNVEQLPDSAELRHRYALLLHLVGDDEATEEQLRIASELEPNWSTPLFTLASLYEDQGRWQELLPLATQLVERWPQELAYRDLLERTRQQLEDSAE